MAAATPEKGVIWSPEGMSQDDFMLKDECIVVNYMDEVVGHDNKYNCHKFLPGQPKGILHRAFSVMLFDSDGRLLLQQRAASKVTFPGVWTNTCCSHPLHGMRPPEVDPPEAVASGNPTGVKHAAVRKLKHELGIPRGELDAARFKFMTRVHYWAADVMTYGLDAPWGEHEIDYLLLYRLKAGETLTLSPHPDEVQAVKWIGREELHPAMESDKWSPWFRIIVERFLDPWWQDLDAALGTDKHVDLSTIHRFDTEHVGGAGNAVANLSALASAKGDPRALALAAEHEDRVAGFVGRGKGAAGAKQGAYGKVPTHSSSTLSQLMRPMEVHAALRFKFGRLLDDNLVLRCGDADIAFCNEMLGKVSRSFAAVIRHLTPELCLDICVFYLALRALDTVEDDMTAYKGREAEKEAELRDFGAKRLTDVNCSICGVGEGDERVLVQNFGKVARVFALLPETSREVIRDVTDKMGAGMAEYVAADLGQGTVDQAAYDRYCHMVAGLVGEGLTRIFIARCAETEALAEQGECIWPFCADPQVQPQNLGLANSMGLFLQKTNIIRDYLEDYVDGRAFWPQSVWKKYATTGELGEFGRPTAHGAGVRLPIKSSPAAVAVAGKGAGVQALHCLNELVADALELVPDSLEYLERIRTPAVYVFCAIPQVMAMATLAECFDNPLLFTGVVKIRKGLTARLICGCVEGADAVHWWFAHFASNLKASVTSRRCVGSHGPVGERLCRACVRIEERTNSRASAYSAKQSQGSFVVAGLAVLGAAAMLSFSSAS